MEILYWNYDIRNLNNKVFREYRIPSLFIYLDAGHIGLVAVYKCKGNSFIRYKNFDKIKKKQSSTCRELAAIHYSLKSSKDFYRYTDNFAR